MHLSFLPPIVFPLIPPVLPFPSFLPYMPSSSLAPVSSLLSRVPCTNIAKGSTPESPVRARRTNSFWLILSWKSLPDGTINANDVDKSGVGTLVPLSKSATTSSVELTSCFSGYVTARLLQRDISRASSVPALMTWVGTRCYWYIDVGMDMSHWYCKNFTLCQVLVMWLQWVPLSLLDIIFTALYIHRRPSYMAFHRRWWCVSSAKQLSL